MSRLIGKWSFNRSSLGVIRHEPIQYKTMLVKLNIDYECYPDGNHPVSFKAGEPAALPIEVAQVFLGDGRASPLTEARAGSRDQALVVGGFPAPGREVR